MAAPLGRSVVLAAVRHEAEQLRAESALVRRRLEALAAIERALDAVRGDEVLGLIETWLSSHAAAGGRPDTQAPIGRAPFDGVLPADVALEDETLVGLVVRLFARFAEASDVDLGRVDLAEAAPVLSPAEHRAFEARPWLTVVGSDEPGEASGSGSVNEMRPSRRRARSGTLSATVYGFLATMPYAYRPIDIARRLDRRLENVCAALVVLEHRGLVDKHEGKFYARVPAAPPAPAVAAAPPPRDERIVRDGDYEFEVVAPPRASAYLGSSIGSRAIGE